MKKKWKRKDYSFARFFKAWWPTKASTSATMKRKARFHTVWPRKKGTYVRKIHGVLPHSKNK